MNTCMRLGTALSVVYFDNLIVWILAIVDLPVAQMILIRIAAVVDTKLDILITDNVLSQSLLIEARKQRSELFERRSLVYDYVDGRSRRAELEEDPRLILCSCVVIATQALEVSLVGIENSITRMHVRWVGSTVFSRAFDSHLDVFITEHALMAFYSEKSCEQNFELSLGHSAVHEDVNEHAGLAKSEVDPAAVFCPCLVIATEAIEVGFVGVETRPVPACTHWLFHCPRD